LSSPARRQILERDLVETGEHLTLTIHDGDFADEMAPTTFRISRFEARLGILAAIERIADGQAFRRRQLQELQRETLEAIASGWSRISWISSVGAPKHSLPV
jgi:hypothetical protein